MNCWTNSNQTEELYCHVDNAPNLDTNPPDPSIHAMYTLLWTIVPPSLQSSALQTELECDTFVSGWIKWEGCYNHFQYVIVFNKTHTSFTRNIWHLECQLMTQMWRQMYHFPLWSPKGQSWTSLEIQLLHTEKICNSCCPQLVNCCILALKFHGPITCFKCKVAALLTVLQQTSTWPAWYVWIYL